MASVEAATNSAAVDGTAGTGWHSSSARTAGWQPARSRLEDRSACSSVYRPGSLAASNPHATLPPVLVRCGAEGSHDAPRRSQATIDSRGMAKQAQQTLTAMDGAAGSQQYHAECRESLAVARADDPLASCVASGCRCEQRGLRARTFEVQFAGVAQSEVVRLPHVQHHPALRWTYQPHANAHVRLIPPRPSDNNCPSARTNNVSTVYPTSHRGQVESGSDLPRNGNEACEESKMYNH